jgi:hypothetical protein
MLSRAFQTAVAVCANALHERAPLSVSCRQSRTEELQRHEAGLAVVAVLGRTREQCAVMLLFLRFCSGLPGVKVKPVNAGSGRDSIGRDRRHHGPAPKEQPPRKLSGKRTDRIDSISEELAGSSPATPKEQAPPAMPA